MPSFVVLLPYVEQQALYQQRYQEVYGLSGSGVFSGGPFVIPVSIFVCPSDNGVPSPPVVQDPSTSNYYAVTSYRPNAGAITDQSATNAQGKDLYWTDGVIVDAASSSSASPGSLPILAITDGTSNTILWGESNNFDPNWPLYANVFSGNPPLSIVGSTWSQPAGSLPSAAGDFPLNYHLPQTVPTGGDTAFNDVNAVRNGYGSGHTNGANFAFCDGSVHFISNGINNASQVASSYNGGTISLLGALCTRDGGEVVNATQY